MKRGLSRLWLVASALWIAIAGIAFIPKVVDEFSALRAEEKLALSRKVFKPLDVDENTLRGMIEDAARKPLLTDLIDIMKQVAAPLQHPAVDREAIRKLLSETHIPPPPGASATFADRLIYHQQIDYAERSPVYISDPAKPFRLVAISVATGVVPPLIVLLLGSAVYWAVAGFSKKE